VSTLPSRRRLLATGLAVGALPLLSDGARASASPKRLIAGTRVLEVNGRAARVFALTGPDGTSGLRLAPGERFRVDLTNQTGTRTLIHWHGQLPPWTQDGFPWPQTPPIADGAVQTYDYAPVAGTYWMHSHYGMQEQNLMTAPLIVHSDGELREDRQEVVLMLHDFTFRTPEEVLDGLRGISAAGPEAAAHNMDEMSAGAGEGKMAGGRVVGMPGMSSMAKMTASKSGMHMDLNDVQYDAFLANDRTLADPDIVRVDRGGRIRLRIINAASSSQFWIDLGELIGRVVATDGWSVREVTGSRFPLAMAQRLDILVDCPQQARFRSWRGWKAAASRRGSFLPRPLRRLSRSPTARRWRRRLIARSNRGLKRSIRYANAPRILRGRSRWAAE
jgi:FtsP/CotA-like multicopper oxidase with cupredoxin domain